MARKQEQDALPGIPGPAKRKIIASIEGLCEEKEKLEGKRSKLGQDLDEVNAKLQAELVEHELMTYVYEDGSGVMQDITREEVVRKRKSKQQPGAKPPKKRGGDE